MLFQLTLCLFFSILFRILTIFFFFNDTATTEIYTLSLHDLFRSGKGNQTDAVAGAFGNEIFQDGAGDPEARADRKSTRLNSSHTVISYAVFCLKKKKN